LKGPAPSQHLPNQYQTSQHFSMNTTSNLHYLPWTWTVKPSDANARCPSSSSILETFAIVNVLVSFVGIVFGNRIIVNKTSCGLFGEPGSQGWKYTWLITLTLQFASNFLVAKMTKHTKGYENDFSITEVMIFFEIELHCLKHLL
jgi:hypothetical protein